MAFCLYRSNRVERLGEALADVVRVPLSSPFARECVVVQGPGMERWLASFLATRLGVWANPWFPFPRALVELTLDVVLGPVPEEERWYAPEPLAWLVARVLPSALSDPALASLASYLRDDVQHDRLMSVSAELAAALDQCMVYRPELVLGWEAGEGTGVHASVWRALRRVATSPHLASRLRDADRTLRDGRASIAGQGFPERVSLFGISSLPPAFLSVLQQLSTHIDVHFFLLTPSPEYWGDFDARLAKKSDLHGFLASLGKVGRDLMELLVEVPYAEPAGDLFEAPREPHMLAGLQADLATLTARAQGETGELSPRSAREGDDSLSVHVCHSPVRELEVLREQLRVRLERNPTLMPHDVVVLAPDIERYAAAIHAVFAAHGDDDASFIPYHVADRKASKLSLVTDAFAALLDLVGSRLGLSEVLDLLQREPVRARFGIAESDLERIEQWLSESGARWAMDGEHRASFGQPAFEENTLRFAEQRLLLGYASAHGTRSSFRDVLPFADVEGREALILGRAARFLESLFETVRELRVPRSAAAWADALTSALERMLSAEDELAYEHQALKAALAELEQNAARADMNEVISLASVRRAVLDKLDRRRASVGFLSGGVTFCEHVPMRAIPFRVVALVGMDDESFPRRGRRSPFDLLREAPRPGDRNLRDDDRQIFLEALLSARDAVIVTYVGRSAKDDAIRPASVLVDRLLSLVDRQFVLAAADGALRLGFEGSVSAAITRVHALHRFDPRYFSVPAQPGYESYEASACAAARALGEPSEELPVFVPGPLPARADRARVVTLDELVRFFKHPQRGFLEQRLGVHLLRDDDALPDREPTVLSPLERHHIGDALLTELRAAHPDEYRRILRQEGRLPPGTLGELALRAVERQARAVLESVDAGPRDEDLPFTLELAETRLVGRIDALHGALRIERTFSKLSGRVLLGAWIRHLAYVAVHARPGPTLVVSRDADGEAEIMRFRPQVDARPLLEELLSLHALGLRSPLPFFVGPAYEAARELAKERPVEQALSRAHASLVKQNGGRPSEAEEPCVLQVFRAQDLERFGELVASDETRALRFLDLVERVMLPLVRHLERGEP